MAHSGAHRRAFITAGLLLGLFLPAGGRADLGITWFELPGSPGAEYVIDFDCSQPDSSYRLFATFASPVDVPALTELRAGLQFVLETAPHMPAPPLPDFLHFESCNFGALQVGHTLPVGAPVANPWKFGATYESMGYQPHDGLWTSYGDLGISIVHLPSTAIAAGTTYFAFTLDVLTCMADVCSGCAAPFRVSLGDVWLVGSDGQEVHLRGYGYAQVCVNMNGWCGVYAGGPGQPEPGPEGFAPDLKPLPVAEGPCAPVVVRPGTWGSLKIRYR